MFLQGLKDLLEIHSHSLTIAQMSVNAVALRALRLCRGDSEKFLSQELQWGRQGLQAASCVQQLSLQNHFGSALEGKFKEKAAHLCDNPRV